MNSDEDSENENIKSTSLLPWIEKYRPKLLDDIISHEQIVHTFKIFIKEKNLPHLLLYGPPGTGKTSLITAYAKELYGEQYQFMVMELNASDDRGIEVVRTKIIKFVMSKNLFASNSNINTKLVILDETDAMTNDAQDILRKVIEEYTNTARFCLICNYIQNIKSALQSRCTKFRLVPLNKVHIKKRILNLIKKEQIKMTTSGIDTIIKRSNGDMRKVLNNLQATSMAYDIINEKNVNTCLGYPGRNHIETIINYLINSPFKEAYNNILFLKKSQGLSINDIITEIHDIIVEFVITNNSFNKNIEKLTLNQIIQIFKKMKLIEYNQSVNTTENIQLSALISVFYFD